MKNLEDKIAEVVAHIELTKEEIANCKEEIATKENEMSNVEIDESEHEDSYCEMLDSEGTISAGGYDFYPSRVLRELDPIAYNCGLSDYCCCLDVEDTDEYKELESEKEELESELYDLEERLEEEEEELIELEMEQEEEE